MGAALFDLDGTLVDSERLAIEALLAAATHHGHALSREAIERRPGAHFAALLVDELRIDLAEATAICSTYDAIFLEVAVPKVEPLPGADALLNALARAGAGLGIVTNKPRVLVEPVLRALSWDRVFTAVIPHGATPENKPSPMPALAALRMLATQPANAVFIGDTESDMLCGSAAGLRAVIAVDGSRPRESLRSAGASHLCASLWEVGEVLGLALR
jgi:HAD superfamily hydrolase (TIGR01509 family)